LAGFLLAVVPLRTEVVEGVVFDRFFIRPQSNGYITPRI
jgi:hypothetical protein